MICEGEVQTSTTKTTPYINIHILESPHEPQTILYSTDNCKQTETFDRPQYFQGTATVSVQGPVTNII